MKTKLLIGVLALVAGGSPLFAQADYTYDWKTTLSSGTWTTKSNWITDSPNPGISGNGQYNFLDVSNVTVGLGGALNIYGVRVGSGAQNITIAQTTSGSYTPGVGDYLYVKVAGIAVDSGSSLTVNSPVILNTTTGNNLNLAVQDTGTLTLNNRLSVGANITVNKTGGGLLVLNSSSASNAEPGFVRAGASFNFAEGTVHLGGDYNLISTATPAQVIPVALGSASTSATLRGAGSIAGLVTTYGTTRSTIDMTHGALRLSNVDATAGVAFTYDLDSLNALSGTGTLSLGENAVFSFAGGTAGSAYTLLDYNTLTINPLDMASWTISGPYVLDATYGDGGWLLDNGELSVRFEAIPEPSTVLMGIAGGTLLILMRRRTAGRGA